MSKEKSQNIDDGLIGVPEIYTKLATIRSRFPNTEEGTDEFIQLVPFLQYGVPYGELVTLRSEPLLERSYREFDPIDEEYGEPEDDMGIFYRYVQKSQTTYEEGYSLVLFGANGSGKTMLALFILCGMIERGRSGYYIHFKDYMRIFNDSTYAREEGTRLLLRHLTNCDLLVIDEVGKESTTTANVMGEFEHLLKHRNAQRLPTILISNLRFGGGDTKVMSFEDKYSNSVMNILLQRYRFFQLSKAGNFRAKMRKEWQI